MKKVFLRIMYIAIAVILVVFVSVYIFLQQAKFGAIPSGERLERIQQSPHYKDGSFQNLSVTPDLTEGVSYYTVMKEFFFSDKSRSKPSEAIPSIKTDLLGLDPKENMLIWFGHSSYFMQIDGKTFLVDPVFSGAASPVKMTTKAFKGTDAYTVNDLPEIDYLLISHDHWDHLDYETILELKPKVNSVVTGLGTGQHFEAWGYNPALIIEEDWNTKIPLETGFTIHTLPARHFSGRALTRNKALWTSFALLTPSLKIYIGGDSGYDTHFSEIGDQFGGFDLAILENGQYDKSWRYIHMLPDEVLTAANDLNAKRLFPVHSSKFALANHDWDTPLKTITSLNEEIGIPLVTPKIGEVVQLQDSTQVFSQWWLEIN